MISTAYVNIINSIGGKGSHSPVVSRLFRIWHFHSLTIWNRLLFFFSQSHLPRVGFVGAASLPTIRGERFLSFLLLIEYYSKLIEDWLKRVSGTDRVLTSNYAIRHAIWINALDSDSTFAVTLFVQRERQVHEKQAAQDDQDERSHFRSHTMSN